MARLSRRFLALLCILTLLMLLSREVGARRSGGTQLAYGYHDRASREAATYLVDTQQRLQMRLRFRNESVKLIGWLDSRYLLVELGGQLTRFRIGQGWLQGSVCPNPGCTLAIVSSTEPVGTWVGRTGQDMAPQWSPDGERVAMMRRVGSTFALLLYVSDVDGNTRRMTRRGVLGLNYFWRPCPEAGCLRS